MADSSAVIASPEPKPISKARLEYQDHLKMMVVKSQDAFEKQLSYISSGSLTFSIAFIENVVGPVNATLFEGYLILAWILMALTLLINLLSHVYTATCHSRTINEISKGSYSHQKAMCRYRDINRMNYLSIGTLISGIASLLFFISKNI